MNTLIIRTGGVGDCILTLPVLSFLQQSYPEAELHVLGNPTMNEVVRLSGMASTYRSIDGAGFAALFSNRSVTDFLRDYFQRYDNVLFFTAHDRSEAERTVLDAGADECRALDPRPPKGYRGHISVHLLSILGEYSGTPPVLPVASPAGGISRVPGRLAIHPGGGGLAKTWPLDRFLDIAARWRGETIFIIGPAERERGMADRIPGDFRVFNGDTLAGTFDMLASAGRYLGCDSGVSHLAALARTPSTVLFGPTDPKVWRPLGDDVTVIASPDGTMEGIAPDTVMTSLTRSRT